MAKVVNIAIDGPSGAGKSTVAKLVAARLGYTYLDTGAMYRAIALKALKSGIDPNDAAAVVPMLADTNINLVYRNGAQHISLDGTDVSCEIREHRVSKAASDVSKIREVRSKLVELQREIAADTNVVVDGRDIASFVLPHANAKFYLTASPEVRARRRYDELVAKGQPADYSAVLQDINDRDYNDMHRDFAPLIRVKDATLVDSTEMTIQEVVEMIVKRSGKHVL